MSETIPRPFTFVKEGIFYFSRRVPNELKSHYTSPRIAFSLGTRAPKIAEARARKAADRLDAYWYHLKCQDVQLPGKQCLSGIRAELSLLRAAPIAHLSFVSPAPISL